MLQTITFRKFFVVAAVLLTLLSASQAGRASAVTNTWTSRGGPGGAGISALAIDPAAPSTLYAGTPYGIYKTTDGGGQWTAANTGMSAGPVHILSIDPLMPSTLYLVTTSGRLFKSTDGAATWNEISTGQTLGDVRALVIDPLTPATLYLGTENGVFKSTDSGGSWHGMNAGLADISVNALAIDPLAPAVLYAGTGTEMDNPTGGGVFKTTDGGEHWTGVFIQHDDDSPVVYLLAIDPVAPGNVYAIANIHHTNYYPPGPTIFKSADGGDTWTGLSLGLPMDSNGSIYYLAIDPAAPTTLYAARDYTGVLPYGPIGEYLDMYKSTDQGDTWNQVYNIRAVSALAFDPSGPGAVYAGTDAGVFKSANAGGSWSEKDTGLVGLPVMSLAVDPQTPATVYTGTSYGVYKSTDGAGSWNLASTNFYNNGKALPVFCLAVDPKTPSTLYAGSESETVTLAGPPIAGESLYKSTDGGTSWAMVSNGPAGLSSFDILALVIDPQNPNTLYAATNGGRYWEDAGLYKSTDGGNNWDRLATGLSYWSVTSLVMDPQSRTTLYAGFGAQDQYNGISGVIKSTDGGGTWRLVSTGLPDHSLDTVLAIDPHRPAILYAGMDSGVYKSTDGGESWLAAGSGLPAGQVSALAIDPHNTPVVYAGTGAGVFKSINGGETWVEMNTGLTNGSVHALAMDPAAPDMLYAGTNEGVFVIHQVPPTLTINYADGQQGSVFIVTGSNFPPAQVVTIAVNGFVSGAVLADASGNLHFSLQTPDWASTGFYLITTAEYPGAAAQFFLQYGKPVRTSGDSGTVIVVPGSAIGYRFFAYFPLTGK